MQPISITKFVRGLAPRSETSQVGQAGDSGLWGSIPSSAADSLGTRGKSLPSSVYWSNDGDDFPGVLRRLKACNVQRKFSDEQCYQSAKYD